MDIEHISVSRSNCFKECPKRYRYRYHDKLEPNIPEPPYFVYGKTVHKIVEHYVRGKGELAIDKVAYDVMSGKILLEEDSLGPPQLEPAYLKKLPTHIKNLKNFTDRIGFDGEVEYKFKYDLDPPNKRLFTGFIDRIIIRGDNFYIIDYKTSKKNSWRKNAHTIKHDLQLSCYAKVVQKEFGAKATNIKAALYYVEGPNLVATKFNEKSLAEAEEELLQAHVTISNMAPEDAYGKVGNHCFRCDYRDICPFFSGY